LIHFYKRITFNMNKFIVAVALFGAVMGDGTGHGHSAPAASASGYAAPADAYASPAAEYAAPSYEAPAASYGAPTYEQEYAAPAYEAAPTGYDSGYGVPAAEGLDFDLSQLTELLPLFVAVFAAIIVAQLVAPLFGALFGAKVALFGGIFNPLGQIKFDIINAILNPLSLQVANCVPANGACTGNANFAPRSLDSLNVIDMIEAASSIYSAMQ
jgi:hypothetical protein